MKKPHLALFFAITFLVQFSYANCPLNANDNIISELSAPKLFESKAGAFKINFPSEPKLNTQTLELNNNLGSTTIYMYMYEGSDYAFVVSYNDYSQSLMDQKPDLIKMLDNAVSGFNKNLKITLDESKHYTLQGFPAVNFRAKSESAFVDGIYLLVGKRLYMVGIMRSDKYPSAEEVEKFNKTFELIK